MHPCKCVVLSLACFSLASIAHANDGFGELGVGGIVLGKTDKVAMAREQLDVSCSLIHVSYDFVNESDEDVTTTVIFPLPAYASDTGEDNRQGQPSGFSVLVDGKPVLFDTLVRATLKGVDVTDRLKTIGFSERQIALFPFDKSLVSDHQLRVPDAQKEALKDAGLSQYGGPNWDIHVSYAWKQTFPAHKRVHVEHSYQPFVANGTASGYNRYGDVRKMGVSPVSEFCPRASQVAQLDRLLADKMHLDVHGQISGAIIEYVLTTANTWKDGIRDFTLRIHTGTPDEIVATCFPGQLTKRPGNIQEVHLKNFRPSKDLRVYIGNQQSCPAEISFGEAPTFK